MKNLAAVGLMLSLVLGCGSQHAWADSLNVGDHDSEPLRPQTAQPWTGSFNLGLGVGFADVWPDNSTAAWDVQAGFENAAFNGWNFGAQVHLLNGSLISDTTFNSMALYATARSENKWLRWLQLKAGVVDASYSDTSQTYNPSLYRMETKTTKWGGTGTTVGAGIVVGEGELRWHILDVQRYFVAGRSFNVYSISLAVILCLGDKILCF